MTLTSAQILSLVRDAQVPGRAGRLESARRDVRGVLRNGKGRQYGPLGPQHNKILEAFIDDLDAQPERPTVTTYKHPASSASRTFVQEPLSQSDLLWLDRLPREPERVTYEDAVVLAELAARPNAFGGIGSKGLTRSDRRLIDSVWAPIKALHDRRTAEAALANAKQPTAPTPKTAAAALAQAYAREIPQLTANEARARAEDSLRAITDDRTAKREQAIDTAKDALEDIDGRDTKRTALVR